MASRPPLRSVGVVILGAALAGMPACHAADPQPATKPAAKGRSVMHTNRLINAKSPYLQQHAHNPVDWYPWGDEAFARAKKENKPIFLSVGYSTCHWCHVMERESFENEEVAKLMNDSFICIKVDREERPDLDKVYMAFVQGTTGSGGWPMTVFLTPEAKPFFGATYFPAETKDGMIGMKTLLPRVAESWQKDREKIVASADNLTKALKEFAARDRAGAALADAISPDRTIEAYRKAFDKQRGGFGGSPKFPEPPALEFMFRHSARSGSAEGRNMVLTTLQNMTRGGINDQLGGGFHRYSTDADWFLPHFEKMLYDEAQLASLYVDAYRMTGEAQYATVARDILDYVLRDLTGPEGQFYSAEDADSAADPKKPNDKREGAFYVWTSDELDKLLGADAAVFKYHFGVKPTGNVDHDPRHELENQNVLAAVHTIDETAKQTGKPPADVERILSAAKSKLMQVRSTRPRPHRDEKALACWNGLAISAFARAGVVLDEPRYTQASLRAIAFVREHLYDGKTRTLYRHWRDGRAEVPGFIDDYTHTVTALIDLYETTLDVQWLKWALELQTRQDELFWDKEHAGYFHTAGQDASVLLRMKDDQEGVEPSGNSAAALNLARLAQMTDDKSLGERSDQVIKAYAGRVKESPTAMPLMVVAAGLRSAKPKQIVLAGDPTSPGVRAMLKEAHKRYIPDKIILAADGGAGQEFLGAKMAFIKEMKPVDGKPTAFVCENYTCKQPATDVATLAAQLQGKP